MSEQYKMHSFSKDYMHTIDPFNTTVFLLLALTYLQLPEDTMLVTSFLRQFCGKVDHFPPNIYNWECLNKLSKGSIAVDCYVCF